MPCVIGAGASLLPLRFLSAAIIGWLSGGGQRQRAGLIALIILLSGCTARPPVLFRSPLATPDVSQAAYEANALTFVSPVYLPVVDSVPNKLGVAGCGPCGALGCAWCYSWSPWPGAPVGVERVPMIRDATNVNVTQLGGNSAWLMGFNEPDLAGQANLSPERAAELWRELERKWPDRKLVAPAPSHLHPEWLVQWWVAYEERYGQPPRVDALALHCYLSADNCIRLAQEYAGLAEVWGIREGWVTEFAFTPVVPNWEQQVSEFVTYLEQSPFWTHYAPFVSRETCDNEFWDCATAGDPSLFDRFGQLTEVGRAYQRAPQ